MSQSKTNPDASKLSLSERGGGTILCNMEDYHNFVISEVDAVRACFKFETDKAEQQEIVDAVELTLRRIESWCERRADRVQRCVIDVRTSDFIVVVVARDEDPDGSLHDEMAEFDLKLIDSGSKLNLYFLLLRASEAEGIDAFVAPGRSRTLFLSAQ